MGKGFLWTKVSYREKQPPGRRKSIRLKGKMSTKLETMALVMGVCVCVHVRMQHTHLTGG